MTEGAHPLDRASDIDRPLGPTENIYFLLDKLYRLNFVVFAEIDGAFDAARLGDALRIVQSQHPLLRARVALADGRNWFKPIEADAHPIPVETGTLRNRLGSYRQLIGERVADDLGDDVVDVGARFSRQQLEPHRGVGGEVCTRCLKMVHAPDHHLI